MNECIIQSTAYADLLAITLPLAKPHFDHVTVWTKTGDEATKAVCAANGVECRETDGFTANGSRFNRGRVYNEAFKHLRFNDWVTILDSDIALSADYRGQLSAVPLDTECFYGARRYDIQTLGDWEKVRKDPARLGEHTLFRGYGYGYLQMFNVRSMTFRAFQPAPYPEWHDGSEADWRFRNTWGDFKWEPDFNLRGHDEPNPIDPPQDLLRQLPFHVVHLGVTGVNATGRHTPAFGI